MTEDPISWIDDELTGLDEKGLLRRLGQRATPQGVRIVVEGRELVNFGSNDYLGLAADAGLIEAVRRAMEEEGFGSGASPLVTGRGRSHAELEERLARFEGTEAALLFPTGFAANAGTISALTDRGDAILSDRRNHASIIDGCRLSNADVHVYEHGDVDHCDSILRQTAAARRRLIVTDSIFSMDGDAAPLVELADLARRHDAMLMVDEAHATGVFGQRGRGLCEHLGVEDRVHIRVGTLSKALGSMGGFVAGSRSLIDYLVNRARPYIFSTAMPMPVAAAAVAALDIVEQEPQRRTGLLSRAAALRETLRAQGWDTADSAAQIIPIIVGAADAAMRLSAELREQGLFVPGIRPPSVPEGRSLLRISLSHGHTEEMVDRLAAALDGMHR